MNHLVQNNDDSDKIALLSIQGPNTLEAMQSLTDFNLNSLPYYGHTFASFAGFQNTIISNTDIQVQGVRNLF